MRLINATTNYLGWLHAVLGVFLKTHALLTTAVIAATVVSRITRLLAFFLPLKVVLLAGSDGVPRYFAGFITPETKADWIIALALASVACYLITLFLQAKADKYALIGSSRVLQEANKITIVHDQEGVAKTYYAQVCKGYASLLFVVIVGGLGLWLNAGAFLFLGGLVALQFLLAALLLRRADANDPVGVSGYILRKPAKFLDYLASINFLAVFGFLLAGFLYFGSQSVLVAILSILATRQLLDNAEGFVNGAIKLSRAKTKLNALVFKEHQYRPTESALNQRFRELFAKPARTERAEARLQATAGGPLAQVESNWVDSSTDGVALFTVVADDVARVGGHYLERVVWPSRVSMLEHEAFLFRHMSRAKLRAPRLIEEYEVERFTCQLHAHESADAPSRGEWKAVRGDLLLHYWLLEPTAELVSAFCASKPLLHARIDQAFIERMEVAIDSEEEAYDYRRLGELLENVQLRMRELPLFVCNPELSAGNVIRTDDGQHLVSSWGRWKLEPVGFGYDPAWKESALLQAAVAGVQKRGDAPPGLSVQDLLLVAYAAQLEDAVNRKRLKAALRVVPDLLAQLEPADEPLQAASE